MGKSAQHWLVCLPRQDLEHCIEIGTFGLNRKYVLGQVERGDDIICCASKDWKLIAKGSITEPYYISDEPVFLAEGMFPDRVDFQATKVPSKSEVDLKQFLDKLDFVQNLAYWAVYFRNAVVKLSDHDWDLLQKQLK